MISLEGLMRSAVLLVALGLVWEPAVQAQDLVIINARIIDGTGRTTDSGSLVIRGDRILSVDAKRSDR